MYTYSHTSKKKKKTGKHLKPPGLMKTEQDRKDSGIKAVQRRRNMDGSGSQKISFSTVTCTMSAAAAAGNLILSRDPEGFWAISANPVPHPHSRHCHTLTSIPFTF